MEEIMKRSSKLIWSLVLLWAVVLLLCWNVQAAPFLVCDVTPDVVTYNVDLDGVVTSGVIVQVGWIKNNTLYLTDPGGTTTQCHVLRDLGTLTVGAHTVKAQNDAGVWGVSAWSVPLAFSKPTLSPPQGGRLTK
jgi:hypothetical protein